MTQSIETMTISEVIAADIGYSEVALHMEKIILNSVTAANKAEVAERITSIMYDAVGDPFNNVNVSYDFQSLIKLANSVKK